MAAGRAEPEVQALVCIGHRSNELTNWPLPSGESSRGAWRSRYAIVLRECIKQFSRTILAASSNLLPRYDKQLVSLSWGLFEAASNLGYTGVYRRRCKYYLLRVRREPPVYCTQTLPSVGFSPWLAVSTTVAVVPFGLIIIEFFVLNHSDLSEYAGHAGFTFLWVVGLWVVWACGSEGQRVLGDLGRSGEQGSSPC
ncbi:hypothetical protein CFD26_100992 [Aspergillus turcosus]|uniref:Uncharacterized protein n=1 Tax=Aspergillus turcosus TaxID=1245748 RepID=A0A3R7IBE1_9EURO|nr:hypothetical protein CFD26_100992 [Aspergillus turcosus]